MGSSRCQGGESLVSAVIIAHAILLKTENNKGQSKGWPSSPLYTWEIHLGFISHINCFPAMHSHKSPQKDWNGIISLGITSWRWHSSPRAVITQLNVQVPPSPLMIYAWEKCTERSELLSSQEQQKRHRRFLSKGPATCHFFLRKKNMYIIWNM